MYLVQSMESASNHSLKKRKGRYQVIITDEYQYREITRFRIERWTVYLTLSTLFVLLIALTTSLIVYTPLKYYLPGSGYGNVQQLKEYRALKRRTDSLENMVAMQQRYWDAVRQTLTNQPVNTQKPTDTVR